MPSPVHGPSPVQQLPPSRRIPRRAFRTMPPNKSRYRSTAHPRQLARSHRLFVNWCCCRGASGVVGECAVGFPRYRAVGIEPRFTEVLTGGDLDRSGVG